MDSERLKAMIFDMDGTLYQFQDGKKFGETDFGKTVKANILAFIGQAFEIDALGAKMVYDDINVRWNGEISLGIEVEMGILREEFFAATWNIQPERFIVPVGGLVESLGSLTVPVALLTSAPRVWADRALDFMGVREIFENRIFTGEPDVRKPDTRVFQQVAEALGGVAARIVSIGDQEATDIVPAKAIGMRAVRVGGKELTIADAIAPDVVTAVRLLKERSYV